MHLTGYVGLLFSLLAFLFLAVWAGIAALGDKEDALVIVERGQLAAAGGVVFLACPSRRTGYAGLFLPVRVRECG